MQESPDFRRHPVRAALYSGLALIALVTGGIAGFQGAWRELPWSAALVFSLSCLAVGAWAPFGNLQTQLAGGLAGILLGAGGLIRYWPYALQPSGDGPLVLIGGGVLIVGGIVVATEAWVTRSRAMLPESVARAVVAKPTIWSKDYRVASLTLADGSIVLDVGIYRSRYIRWRSSRAGWFDGRRVVGVAGAV
jgi:hypothetical protein